MCLWTDERRGRRTQRSAAVPPASHPSGRLSLSPRSQAPTQRPANRRSRLVSAHPSRRSDSALPNRPPLSSAPACAHAQASLPPPSPLPRRFLFPRGLGRQRGSRRRRRAACGQAPHCPLLKVSARLWAAARAVPRHRRCRGRAEPASRIRPLLAGGRSSALPSRTRATVNN